MKVYTVIEIFSLGGRIMDANTCECYVRNFSKKEDALADFIKGTRLNDPLTLKTLPGVFDDMLAEGYGYVVNFGCDESVFFVRNEEIDPTDERE